MTATPFRKLAAALPLALLLLCSCAEKPSHYGIERLDTLQPNITTQRDLIKRFGMPTTVIPARDQAVIWTWQYPPTDPGTGDDLQLFSILINSDGQMVRIIRILRQ